MALQSGIKMYAFVQFRATKFVCLHRPSIIRNFMFMKTYTYSFVQMASVFIALDDVDESECLQVMTHNFSQQAQFIS